MNINDKNILEDDFDKLYKDLMRSTRTSFKLSKKAIEALDLLVKYTDSGSYKQVFFILWFYYVKLYKKTNDIIFAKPLDNNSTRKSYVIPVHTLNWLNRTSKKNKIPRDQFLENLIISEIDRIEPMVKENKKNISIIEDYIDEYNDAFDKATKKIIELFGDNHPILNEWYNGAHKFENWNDLMEYEYYYTNSFPEEKDEVK